jgi:hypothetical protein
VTTERTTIRVEGHVFTVDYEWILPTDTRLSGANPVAVYIGDFPEDIVDLLNVRVKSRIASECVVAHLDRVSYAEYRENMERLES